MLRTQVKENLLSLILKLSNKMNNSSKKQNKTKWKLIIIGMYLLFWLLYSGLIYCVLLFSSQYSIPKLVFRYWAIQTYSILWLAGICASWWWVTINKWFSTWQSRNKQILVVNQNSNLLAELFFNIIYFFFKTLFKLIFSIIIWIFVAPYKFYELFKNDVVNSSEEPNKWSSKNPKS